MGNECACGRNELEKAADASLDFEKSTKNWIETEEQLNAHIDDAIKVYFNESSDADVQECAELLRHQHEDYKSMLATAQKGSKLLNDTFTELDKEHKVLMSTKKEMDAAQKSNVQADKAQANADDEVKAAEAAEAQAKEEEKNDAQKKTLSLKQDALGAKAAAETAASNLKIKTKSYENKLKQWQSTKKATLKGGITSFYESCRQVTSQQLDEFNAVLAKVNEIDEGNTNTGAVAPPDQVEKKKAGENKEKEEEKKGEETKEENKGGEKSPDENPADGKGA